MTSTLTFAVDCYFYFECLGHVEPKAKRIKKVAKRSYLEQEPFHSIPTEPFATRRRFKHKNHLELQQRLVKYGALYGIHMLRYLESFVLGDDLCCIELGLADLTCHEHQP